MVFQPPLPEVGHRKPMLIVIPEDRWFLVSGSCLRSNSLYMWGYALLETGTIIAGQDSPVKKNNFPVRISAFFNTIIIVKINFKCSKYRPVVKIVSFCFCYSFKFPWQIRFLRHTKWKRENGTLLPHKLLLFTLPIAKYPFTQEQTLPLSSLVLISAVISHIPPFITW